MYRAIDSNNRIIEEQNRIIARNNATIAAQNSSFALNSTRAYNAYSLADRLGLVQSYAYANQPYYYQDGVFYIVNSNGQYEVIVPPAGALVEDLPDDYDTTSTKWMTLSIGSHLWKESLTLRFSARCTVSWPTNTIITQTELLPTTVSINSLDINGQTQELI